MKFLIDQRFFYTRATHFSWKSDGNKPVSSFSESDAIRLVSSIKENKGNMSYFVINCDGIFDVDDHALDKLEKFLSQNSKLQIAFFAKSEKNALVEYVSSKTKIDKRTENTNGCCCVIGLGKVDLDINYLRSKVRELENVFIRELVDDSYHEIDEHVLSSTPLIAPGEFNATSFISHPENFKWICLILADNIHDYIIENELSNVTIVSASLRGATLAAAIWEILESEHHINLCPIDHFGPKHDLLEPAKFHDPIQNSKCIYVGDFLIAGTEVKVLSAYTKFLSGELCAAFVVGKYTVKEKLGGTSLKSLVNLRDCVQPLEYKLN